MTGLAAQLEQDMIADSDEYRRITKTKPTAYLQMISRHGGQEAARRLIADPKHHEGFTRAWEHQCLHLTAEYLATYAKAGIYRTLFSPAEIASAEKKLKALGIIGPV